ncbi:hypothetical protein AMS68_003040 [Peltaster fructicola]|uniref:Signal peptidase complex subunit 2 n=1 Tax=Peltaster fructicola TaxID=286661 RepID=A0A6H0XS34_9PEZI|nr:hypothetical protein AMS68_003040 [Peltaster fructicola]
MSESKISVYNLQELRNTTDDALGNYLRSLGFKQDNSKTDIKLAVGWVAVVIAGVTFAADYKLGWEATKYWTAAAVVAYTCLNSFFTYWLWFVEKGLVFEGSKNGKKISIRTKVNKHDPTYFVDFTVTSGSTGPSTRQLKTPFTTWFTEDGFFVAQPFQQWIASSIEVIGDADQKNALRDQRDALAPPVEPGLSTGADLAADATFKRKKKT